MGRKHSVCRLASQTQLLTVCLTPPTPTLPVLSNVSSRTECETTEIKVASTALDNSNSTQSQNKGLVRAWTGPAVQVADRLHQQLRVRSQTDGSNTWKQEAHPVSSFWKDIGLSSQAIFLLPRPAVS